MKREMRTIEKDKLEALVSENIRLRGRANRIWLKPWFPTALIVTCGTLSFLGAYIAVVVALVESAR